MTDWELENEIMDNDEQDALSLRMEYGELTEWDIDMHQGAIEMKEAGKIL